MALLIPLSQASSYAIWYDTRSKNNMLNATDRKQYVGNRYGRIIVLDMFKKHGTDSRFYIECDCGKKTILFLREIKDYGQCLDCQKAQNKENAAVNMLRRYNVTADKVIKQKMKEYLNGANQRGLSFVLTVKQFTNLITSNCHYCGVEPNRIRQTIGKDFSYLGIDRKNNSIGYVLDNCVSCCWECNRLKGTRGYIEFIAYLDRIAAYRSRK